MRRPAVIFAVLATAFLGAPLTSRAQPPSNPFAPGLPQQTPTLPPTSATPTIVQPTQTSGGGGSLSGGAAAAIGIGALVVLGGISFFIWRDARRRAPVRQRATTGPGEGGRAGTRPRPKPRKPSPAERRRRKRGRAR